MWGGGGGLLKSGTATIPYISKSEQTHFTAWLAQTVQLVSNRFLFFQLGVPIGWWKPKENQPPLQSLPKCQKVHNACHNNGHQTQKGLKSRNSGIPIQGCECVCVCLSVCVSVCVCVLRAPPFWDRFQEKEHKETMHFSRGTFPILSRHPSFWRTSGNPGRMDPVLARTMVEKNG